MIEGVDFAYGRPGGAALVAAGKHFVVRYIGVGGGDGRALTAAEVKDYQAHGLPICLVYESTGGRTLGGRAAGIADAHTALDRMALLDVPSYVPMYFAVDFDARPDQYGTIDAYLQGAATVLGGARIGVYGHADLLAHIHAVKTARWFWQTYAWSYGAQMVGRHLYQYRNGQSIAGAGVDYDRAYGDNYGQWDVVPPAPDSSVEAPVPGVQYQFLEDLSGTVTVTGAGQHLIRADDQTYVDVPAGQVRVCYAKVQLTAPLNSGVGLGSQHWLVGNVVGLTPDKSISALLPLADGTYKAGPNPLADDLALAQKQAAGYKSRLVKINGLSAV